MNREEKRQIIQDYLEFASGKDGDTIERYLDSLEMNKEKAIQEMGILKENWDRNNLYVEKRLALQFAIDYMKSSQDDGEIIGWVNYYPEIKHSHKIGSVTFNSLESAILSTTTEYGECIHIPIRLPKK